MAKDYLAMIEDIVESDSTETPRRWDDCCCRCHGRGAVLCYECTWFHYGDPEPKAKEPGACSASPNSEDDDGNLDEVFRRAPRRSW